MQGSGKFISAQTREADSLSNLLILHRKSDTIRVNLLNAAALKYYLIDDEKTKEYAEESVALADSIRYKKGQAEGLRLIGLYYHHKSDNEQAIEYFQESINLCEEIGDKKGISSCMMNIGSIYQSQNNASLALEYYESALDILEGSGDKMGISTCLNSMGDAYNLQGNHAEALKYFKDALVIEEELEDKIGISNSLMNLGSTYEIQGDYSKALTYLQNSMEIKVQVEDKSGICLLFNEIGRLYFHTNNLNWALEYTRKSLELANELKLLDVQKDNYKQLSDIYYATGDFNMAYHYYVTYKELYDSIFNVQEVAKFMGLEYQYKYEKERQALELEHQKKDAIQAEESKRQRVIRNSFILGFVLMVMLLLVIILNFRQKRKANRKLAGQKAEIESQNNKIKDSIEAAQRIQKALFPPMKLMDEILPEHFIFNKPRDIVSGDYYWLAKREEKIILAVADCTGHGIPGAFMSLLGISFLNEIVNKKPVLSASDILYQLREEVIRSLHQKGEKYEQRDGMDISICIFDFESSEMQYSGAFSQVYLVRNDNLTELKGDKMPVGISVRKDQPFTNKEMKLYRNDCLYLCTDGYSDQIGGPRRKTFRSKYLKELLLRIHGESMEGQYDILEKNLADWRGEIEQIDDILILGMRVR